MKRIWMLLIAIACFSATNAQSSAEKAKRVIRGEGRDYDRDNDARDVAVIGKRRPIYNNRTYSSGNNNRADIDRDYEANIRSIRNNPTLSHTEKDRIIRGLEAERERRIRDVNNDYSNNRRYAERSKEYRRCDDDKNYKNKKAYKRSNGKHPGWKKGKGNPHRWD